MELEFTDDALNAIAEKAIQRGTGARGLRGVMEHLLRHTMYEIPSRKEINRCTIDEQVVLGETNAALTTDPVTEIVVKESIEHSDKENAAHIAKEVPQC